MNKGTREQTSKRTREQTSKRTNDLSGLAGERSAKHINANSLRWFASLTMTLGTQLQVFMVAMYVVVGAFN
jgi:hypothetical protein